MTGDRKGKPLVLVSSVGKQTSSVLVVLEAKALIPRKEVVWIPTPVSRVLDILFIIITLAPLSSCSCLYSSWLQLYYTATTILAVDS
ncbi:unnamed protein product, partial [Amoebophrya sp. A25]|eukprot:GSA25T00019756001.1